MRAPFSNDSTDLGPDDKGIICSGNENERDIHSIVERSLAGTRSNKTAVFGICLDDLMGTTAQVAPPIPFILSRLCRYIETHGLRCKNLFLDGEERKIVENLKNEFSECGDASLESVNNIASVAKLLLVFFEELPEPLIPFSAQPDFISAMEKLSLSSGNCIPHLKQNVGKLPDSAYHVLKYLSRFLLRVACHEEYNGMNSVSLAVIFGPLIFRPCSKDPSIHTQLRDIVSCFVQEYHTIFEDDVKSPVLEDTSKSSATKVCRQLPCPSSVMPVVPLSPLSVVIPLNNENSSNNNSKGGVVPSLLIEGQMGLPSTENKVSAVLSIPIKDNMGVAITRKRKERRFSGEDSQPRSSSEERPNSTTLLSLELIRRCNSHEEMMDDINSSGEANDLSKNAFDNSQGDASHDVDSYLSDTMEIVNEKNHSPHPPNAKRREVETTESIGESSDHWKYQSSKCPRKLDISGMPRCRDSKQNPIADTDKNTMECDASDERLDADKEYLENKVGIPRSASCPVPKTENERENSESESSSLSLSWSMLFEDSEPIRSSQPLTWSKDTQDEALLSPSVHKLRSSNYYEAPLSPSAYRSYLSYRGPHLDPSVPPSPPVEQEDFAKKLVETSGISDSIKQLTKRIHNIKRKLRKFDEKFEAEFGYKPSHAEKSNNAEAKKLLSDLYKARKELKGLKEEAHLEHVSSASSSWHAAQRGHILGDTTNYFIQECVDKSKPSIEDSLGVTLKSLAEDRKTAKRPELVDDMTTDQVKDEKLAIQKALLHLESIHGKPYTKSERNTIRPLYDRYRCVKRLARSNSYPISGLKNKDLCGELQPILEHETMDFPTREARVEAETIEEKEMDNTKSEDCEEENTTEEPVVPDGKKSTRSPCIMTVKYDNSNFHELPLSEMIFQMQKVKSEKRHLRKILKEFETEFMRLNGRKVQKEDKAPVDTIYSEYKHVKARLKLLEALISKHDQHQLM